ncbi:hypothetical protein GCM10011583_22190 [Streptomyces camponoticapitis]|uniref:DUF2264 domain-containing protein n=1 Tax=Streptomyces camponoticapitis TaxID=1616125 RepID=A0ABQ2E3P0_9ACTN|nr:DUF2264 domain-containing protein [Streptomyces camponoticapitis]GGJ90319.1 hypothetical protein GCM10011583_22190 [Streptomyces camponoticapitis]
MTRTPAQDRAHWERTADRLLLAVRPYATGEHALIQLPGTPSHNGVRSDGLEGFARTFLLAGFRLAGAGGADPHDLAGWYAAGLAAGTDPDNPERWPTFAECDQAKVEAASVALALHETRPWIWDRLDDKVRGRVLDWLAPMVGEPMPGNNWIWFQGVTEAFARTAGGQWRQQDLDRVIALTDGWYAGDGWYSDGLTGGEHRNFDHYNGWAMHLYPLWFCRILGDAAPGGLLDRYRDRLRRFLADQRLLVGANGSPLVQGRSLTYRHAALAPVWTGALFDATPLAPGETRGLANRMLDHFTAHGATDAGDLLTLGWHRPYRGILQVYSGPASPYWASKGFIGLALPPRHPVWTEEEHRLGVEQGDFTRTLTAPGWLVSGTASDGVVRVVNHGGDHADPARPHADDPCYARFAYSTHTAPETPGDPTAGPGACADAEPLDNAVVLLDAAGRASHRRPATRISVDGATAVSRSRAHWPEDATWDPFGGPDTRYTPGPWITVGSALRGPVEVRAVRVDGDPGAGHVLRIGGWALATDPRSAPEPRAVDGDKARVEGAGGLVSVVVGAHRLPRPSVVAGTGSNAIGAASATPVVQTEGHVAHGTAHIALVHLGGADPAVLPQVTTRAEDTTLLVEVTWPDGAHDTVRLPAPDPDEHPAAYGPRKDQHRA